MWAYPRKPNGCSSLSSESSECMLALLLSSLSFPLCSVRCPICYVSASSSIRRTLQNCRIWTCGLFSPFRETQSSGRLVQSWRSQWPSGGTRGSTSSRKRIEETSISLRMTRLMVAPGVVRLSAMYLTQHCMLRKPLVGEFALRWNVWNGWILEVATVQSWQAWSVILEETCAWCRGIAWTSQQRQWTTITSEAFLFHDDDGKAIAFHWHRTGFPTFAHFTWPASTSWNQMQSQS